MPRRPRSLLGDGVYHVTSRGTGPIAIFVDEHDFRSFLALLGQVADRCDWACPLVCLMSTHYHLIVEALLVDLSRGLHRLNGLYAQRFNRRYTRSGHLFQSRYDARLIESDEHFEAVYRYVLENPVRAGLCRSAEDWPWTIASYPPANA